MCVCVFTGTVLHVLIQENVCVVTAVLFLGPILMEL